MADFRQVKKLCTAISGAALLFRQLFFDAGAHCVRKITLVAQDGVTLIQDVLLQKPHAAFSGWSWRRIPVFVDGPLSQGEAVYVALGY
jgi:hypothetical protein